MEECKDVFVMLGESDQYHDAVNGDLDMLISFYKKINDTERIKACYYKKIEELVKNLYSQNNQKYFETLEEILHICREHNLFLPSMNDFAVELFCNRLKRGGAMVGYFCVKGYFDESDATLNQWSEIQNNIKKYSESKNIHPRDLMYLYLLVKEFFKKRNVTDFIPREKFKAIVLTAVKTDPTLARRIVLENPDIFKNNYFKTIIMTVTSTS